MEAGAAASVAPLGRDSSAPASVPGPGFILAPPLGSRGGLARMDVVGGGGGGGRDWALVTPDMLVGALARAGGRRRRAGRDCSVVHSVARCLADRYPVCPCWPALLHEIRLKLQCCVQVGILRRDGDWFVPMTGACTGPSRAQLATFWQLYLSAAGQDGAQAPRARGSRRPRLPSPVPIPLATLSPPPPPSPVGAPPILATPSTDSFFPWESHFPPPSPPPPWRLFAFAQSDASPTPDSDDDLQEEDADSDDEQRLASLDLAEVRAPPLTARPLAAASEEPGAEPEPPPPRLLPPPTRARGAAAPRLATAGLRAAVLPDAAAAPRDSDSSEAEDWREEEEQEEREERARLDATAGPVPPHTPRAPASNSAIVDANRWLITSLVNPPPRPRSPTPNSVAPTPSSGAAISPGGLTAAAFLRARSRSAQRSASAPPSDRPGSRAPTAAAAAKSSRSAPRRRRRPRHR